jgi:hypothetical protein
MRANIDNLVLVSSLLFSLILLLVFSDIQRVHYALLKTVGWCIWNIFIQEVDLNSLWHLGDIKSIMWFPYCRFSTTWTPSRLIFDIRGWNYFFPSSFLLNGSRRRGFDSLILFVGRHVLALKEIDFMNLNWASLGKCKVAPLWGVRSKGLFCLCHVKCSNFRDIDPCLWTYRQWSGVFIAEGFAFGGCLWYSCFLLRLLTVSLALELASQTEWFCGTHIPRVLRLILRHSRLGRLLVQINIDCLEYLLFSWLLGLWTIPNNWFDLIALLGLSLIPCWHSGLVSCLALLALIK